MNKHNRFIRKNKTNYKDILARAGQALLSLGGFGILVATCYAFFIGETRLSFERPYGRSYVFSLENSSPADIRVERFRVSYPDQPVIAKTTRAIYAESRGGSLIMPGGNISTVPIVKFHELDGEIISSRSTHRFRLPPLNSRDYLELEAAIFEISYEVTPKNKALSLIDKSLKFSALRNKIEAVRYLVVDNYWIPTRSRSPREAIRLACRDNDMLSEKLCSELVYP